MLAAENGERILTNILHLAEILHQEAVNQGLNMTGLLGYLHERLARDQAENIEHQLRLESDEDRVKIVTIHKAKGLEYPVVFCPFTWEGLRSKAKSGCLHKRIPEKHGHMNLRCFHIGTFVFSPSNPVQPQTIMYELSVEWIKPYDPSDQIRSMFPLS